MTTTDVTPERVQLRTNGNGATALSDQVVLSGAGLLTETIGRAQSNTAAFIDAVDEAVLGTIDLIEEFNALSAQVVPQLVSKPAALARKAYMTASASVRKIATDV